MASQKPNITEIIKKLLSDPRVVNVVTQVLAEMLSDASNVSENPATNQPTQVPSTVKTHKVIDWTTRTDATLRTVYAYRKKKGLAIEPELNAALAARFPGYDAELKVFTGRKPGMKTSIIVPNVEKIPTQGKVRIINWTKKSDDILRNAYKHRKGTTGIDDALDAELARRFPTEYDPTTRTLIKRKKFHNFTTKGTTKSALATAKTSNTTRHVASTPNNNATQPVAQEPIPSEKPHTLSVKLKLVRQSLQDAYYDVYVNGQQILRNHANTELSLFADGALLGVYGTVTNNKDLPQRPLWLVFNTDLKPNKWSTRNKYSRYCIYINQVLKAPNGINLYLSNNRIILLDTEKQKRMAGNKRFEIER